MANPGGSKCRIHIKNTGQSFEVNAGTSVLECAIENDIALDHDCGGNCACTTCHIHIEDGAQNLEPMGEDERGLLEANDKLDSNSRLGCQARIQSGTVVIRIPE